MFQHLLPVNSLEDILPLYQGTPVGELLAFQNLSAPLPHCDHAQLLVAMCMDHRKTLRLPANFAYIIRTGGANLEGLEFKVSYAIAIAGVQWIALLAHNECGMVGVKNKREQFIQGMVAYGGWTAQAAADHFDTQMPRFHQPDEIDFTRQQARRLSELYPRVGVAPLYYDLYDHRLYQLEPVEAHQTEERFR